MGRCSYSWREWNEEKDEFVEKCCRKETWKSSDEFCIFHDPSPEKDADLFRKLFEEQIKTETEMHDFTGYYFPEKWDFFAGKKLEISVSFEDATFQSADFRGTTFQDASFRKTIFQSADFWGATFQGTVDFWGASFHDFVNFGGVSFQNTDFWGANFQSADFWGAAFQSTADFRRATFQDANFGETIFQSTVDFWGTTFQSTANFRKTIFQNTVDFRGATFQSIADFGRAAFKSISFGKATFQDADFGKATFRDADFGKATFRDASFRGATFQDADFWGATFQSTADFEEASFQGTADFGKATFRDASFRKTIFQSTVDFRGTTFEKKLEFAPNAVKRIDFREAEFLFRSKVTANLGEALCQRASLENVAFIDCTWPEGYVIYEERHMNDENVNLSLSQLETIYRDLKQNMRNHGDYVRAGEFYYREMEIRRKGISRKKINRWWFEVYRFLAGYGEKPYLVVRNSFLVILLAAILFFFCGVARVGAELPLQESPDIIKYSIHSLSLNIETLKDFGYCLYYSIVTFTTLGYGDIHPLGYSHILASAEALTGAFFMALFVLVFGRKMMR